MSRHKASPTICYWMSARPDCREKRFVQLGNSLIHSTEFQKLSYGARWLYICMAMESAGRSCYTFPLSSAKRCGFPQTSFRRYVNELKNSRFIEVQSNKSLRQPNGYQFNPAWKDGQHPR